MLCNKDHSSIQKVMQELPDDQGGIGRHKCAACAYEQGYQDGRNRIMSIDIVQVVGSLSESRHKIKDIKVLTSSICEATMTAF